MMIITDIVMYFIRLSSFFITMFLLLSLVGGLKATVEDNALQRTVVQLAEGYFNSEITVSRGVFNMTALAILDGNTTELARVCSYPSFVEFSTIENGRQLISRFGYKEPLGGGSSQEFPVWIKSDQQMLPGVMRLNVWQEGSEVGGFKYAGLPTLFCSLERAWTYKVMQKEFEFTCPFETCVLYTYGDNVCFGDRDRYDYANARCRYMPGVNVTDDLGYPRYIMKGDHKFTVVPIKPDGRLMWDSPDIAKGPTDAVGTLLLCEYEKC